MISQQDQTANVVTNGSGSQHVARIKESPKAFHILSGALYSDKILAVVRELSTNAYDAHVAAGKKDVPFELKLPTNWDSAFYVKDFGTGLTEDQIYNLYMVYFESTKSGSNDFVGTLGLGSKSPFSYDTSFTVESRQGGFKKVYVCFKNEQLMPAVTKLSEAPTDEPDGLTIAMSIKSSDADRFREAVEKALKYFDPAPKIIGAPANLIKIEHTHEGTNWKLRHRSSGNHFGGSPRVVQGFISYPIDWSIVRSTINMSDVDYYDLASARNSAVDFFVPIGDVEIAPSREALTYDARTCQNLFKAIQAFDKELKAQITTEVQAQPTLWKAMEAWQTLEEKFKDTNVPKSMWENMESITYNGVEYGRNGNGKIMVDIEVYPRVETARTDWVPKTINIYRVTGAQKKSVIRPEEMPIINNDPYVPPVVEDGEEAPPPPLRGFVLGKSGWSVGPTTTPLIVIDDTDGTVSRSDIMRRLGYNLHRSFGGVHVSGRNYPSHQAIFITATDRAVGMSDLEIKVLMKKMGHPNTVLMSSLPEVPKAQYKYAARPKEQARLLTKFTEKYGPRTWSDYTLDPDGEGMYLVMSRWEAIHIGIYQLDNLVNAVLSLGLATREDLKIVGVTEKQEKMLGEGWVRADKHLIDLVATKAAYLKDAYECLHGGTTSLHMYSMNELNLLIQHWSPAYDAVPELVAYRDELARQITAVNTTYKHLTTGIIDGWVNRFGNDCGLNVVRPQGFRPVIYQLCDAVFEAYPKMKYISIRHAADEPDGQEMIALALTK
jgi:hypothetical protein